MRTATKPSMALVRRPPSGIPALPSVVCPALHAQPHGLTSAEVAERLDRYGANRLRPPARRGPLRRLLLQFHNVLIYVLLAAAAMTAALAHWVDAGVIVAVVVINALIGFIQEGKAEQAIKAIRGLLSQQAAVRRDGQLMHVGAEAQSTS